MEFDPKSEGSNGSISPPSSDDPRIADEAPDRDITSAILADGWSPLERDGIGPFRIASSGAAIAIPMPPDSVCALTIELEPVDPDTPAVVLIVSSTGIPIVTAAVATRRSLRAVLPLRRSDLSAVRLITESKAELRVRSIETAELAGDIIVARSAMVIGTYGWGEREYFAGELFRWVDNDAEIRFLGDFRCSQLTIDLEPGHSIPDDVMDLVIFDDRGNQLATLGVAERSRIEVNLKADTTGGIRLHVINGGAPIPGDSRTLNMRVFGVRITAP